MTFDPSLAKPLPVAVHSMACYIRYQNLTNYLVIFGGFDSLGVRTKGIYKLNLQDIPGGWTLVAEKNFMGTIGSSTSVFRLPRTAATIDTYIYFTHYNDGKNRTEGYIFENTDRLLNASDDGKFRSLGANMLYSLMPGRVC